METKTRRYLILMEADDSTQELLQTLQDTLETHEEKKKELNDSLKALEEKQKIDLVNAENTIKKTKESIEKIKSAQEIQTKMQASQEKMQAAQGQTVTESSEENDSILIRRSFARMNEDEASVPKKQPVIVNFDKSTDTPFQVKFTERGFLIGNTRLSFELLEVAINKEFNITLDNGKGLTLDAVRMQKILKYKDRV